MLQISATEDWRVHHPGAKIGLLEISGTENPSDCQMLEDRKRETQEKLRTDYKGFTRPDFLSLPVIAAYDKYYGHFDKTYHVQLQIESIVLKGKDLPRVLPLVDANFMAEVETMVLTAGHDVDKLFEPILIDVSRDGDQLVQMNGTAKEIRPGDMIMRDGQGISCSVLYGQDNRSPISTSTTHVLYVAYAPVGVPCEALEQLLNTIEEIVLKFTPQAVTEQKYLITA
jgi:DNA/RNA-binding domain of Phe-tRNA-synthetase-like protein